MTEWPKTIYESIKLPFLKAAISLNLTSVKISLFNHALTLTFGTYFFSRGSHLFYLGGLAVCLVNGFLDYLDGDVARAKKEQSEVGAWLDSGFDVIIQNAVLGAIAVGCYKQGLSLNWIILFFIGNTSSNFVSFYYNERFGFDSARGNSLFRDYMDKSRSRFDGFLKEMIDPTASPKALALYTYRYWIVLGCLFNIMPFCFIQITIINNFRWAIMYIVYALYLKRGTNWHVINALSVLDEERDEFYRLRHSR